MPETNVMPPMFLALEREAHMAEMVSATLAKHPGATVQYGDSGLIDDLCDELDDWSETLDDQPPEIETKKERQ